MSADKYVFLFEDGDGCHENILKLGNKGAQLGEMTRIGLPVPPGFTIGTQACVEFFNNDEQWPAGLEQEVKAKLAAVEKKMGKKLGDAENPMLVSVRSGSYVSMPGMMDSVLNLGMNDKSVVGFAKATNNERAAYDSYRRFLQMFGDVVLGVEHSEFEALLEKKKETKGVEDDTELDADDLKELVNEYKAIVRKKTGEDFPQDAWHQLKLSIDAVFRSWNTERAIAYRKINNLRDDAGTGVNVQAMVFGNMGSDSGTGVAFTRNPATGTKEYYGEFLIDAQGEDVVAGIRTPEPINKLKQRMPRVYEELIKVYELLEKHYKDLQDFEFTFEKGNLYLLQTRSGKRTAQAAMKIAVDMEKEGLLSKDEALLKIKPEQIEQMLHKQLDTIARQEASSIAKGLPASPGAAVGQVVFNSEKAVELAEKDEDAILVRAETSPEDIKGMNAAQGILTSRGGMTSHAAVVARGMGKCCVAGCPDISVDEKSGILKTSDGVVIKELDWITLDGSTGDVFSGKMPLIEPEIKDEFKTILSWADKKRKLKVRTNADTPNDSSVARDFGAEGIGLCRTEHMFFEGDRINAVREMIISPTHDGRVAALSKLLPMQKADFIGIFKAMDGFPVTIRFLDPPLHEFLPHTEKKVKELAESMKVDFRLLMDKVESLKEANPMLGHRGCRLAVTFPEIYEMQVKAIIEAALEAQKKGVKVLPEIEVPITSTVSEFVLLKELVRRIVMESDPKGEVKYKIGTMIELPRACIVADKIAEHTDFMSFGTNDLTQTTYGFSRDDVGKFVPEYIAKGLLKDDPFAVLDREGVGSLMKLCVEKARKAKPKIEIGICGEHGGEPSSVEFCHEIGLDYVSCSPYRVPIARLVAGQAVVKGKK